MFDQAVEASRLRKPTGVKSAKASASPSKPSSGGKRAASPARPVASPSSSKRAASPAKPAAKPSPAKKKIAQGDGALNGNGSGVDEVPNAGSDPQASGSSPAWPMLMLSIRRLF